MPALVTDPVISSWFKSLMQPDHPNYSCCGEADAYWADGVEVKDGQTITIITDTRPDEPLGRPHVPVGTRIVVTLRRSYTELNFKKGTGLFQWRGRRTPFQSLSYALPSDPKQT